VVAGRLAISARTLQRRLSEEGTSFQQELNGIREELARHYLTNSHYSSAEISFLLGYDDPNSFIRAFHAWTGQTPERARPAPRLH
ncbi:MAG: helix-turn-helix transcriptional regulator, partial [Pseudomonadota bacterium]